MDRNNYSTGEIANGYFLVQGITFHNKTLKLEVRNAVSKEIVYQSNVKVANNERGFYIPILPEFKSGTYLLDFFACTVTNVTTRAVVAVATTTINIINSNENKLNREAFLENKINDDLAVTENKSFKISSNFSPIDKKYNVSFNPINGDTIKLVIAGDTKLNNLNIKIEQKNWTQLFVNSFSEKIFQKIKVSDDKDQKQFGLLGLYTNDANKMFISKTDALGNAIFILDDYEGVHNFNLFAYQNYNIKAEESEYSVMNSDLVAVSDDTWKNIQADADEAQKRNEIHHYFEVNTFGLKSPVLMKKNVLPKPFWSYNPSNFKKFPDLLTFCKENSLELRFYNSKDGIAANLSPPPRFTNAYDVKWENPFFLIDGKAVNDYKKISLLKPEDIKAMYIYYDKKEIVPWIYAFGSNGVVVIETKTNNNTSSLFKLNGFQNGVTDGQTIISEASTNGKPVLIPTLMWKSNFSSGENTFIVSDNSDKTQKNIIVFYTNTENLFYSSTELK